MKLWFLERTRSTSWDENAGFVIRASSETRARKMAARLAADEGRKTWLDPHRSNATELSAEGAEEIVLQSFIHG